MNISSIKCCLKPTTVIFIYQQCNIVCTLKVHFTSKLHDDIIKPQFDMADDGKLFPLTH